MGKLRDLTGMRFGKLMVLSRAERTGKSRHAYWNCDCDCGTKTVVGGNHLTNRRRPTGSCGCLLSESNVRKKTRHGLAQNGRQSPTYISYISAKSRCEDPNNPHFPKYGGRPDRPVRFLFKNVEELIACIGLRPPRKTIDRYPDKTGDYAPNNVRWATPKEQGGNRRDNRILSAFGQTKKLEEWTAQTGIKPSTIWSRLERGLTPEQALTAPLKWQARFLTAFNETKRLHQWAREYGVGESVLRARLRNGLTPEQAITVPIDRSKTRAHRGRHRLSSIRHAEYLLKQGANISSLFDAARAAKVKAPMRTE